MSGNIVLRPLLCAVVAAALLGCDGEPPGPPFSQRDSAGIIVVESAVARWVDGEGWIVEPEPILDLAISGTGPSHEFFQVRDATRLRDGAIAVANSGSHEIRLFSATGTFIRGAGGEGEGPGEFRGIWSVDRYRGDSLVTFDYQLIRATVLSPQLEASRIIRFQNHPLRDLRPLSDGSFIARLYWASMDLYEGQSGVLVREPDPLVRFSDSGDILDTIAMAAGYEEFMDDRGATVPLFGKDSHFSVHDGRIYLGDADEMEFKIFSASGRLERVIRASGLDFSISSRDMDDERDGRLGPNPSPRRREAFSRLPVPDSKPAYTRVLVDSEGCIWAEEYRHIWLSLRSTRPRIWNVFAPQGEWLGSVRLPAPFAVFEIGADYILGVSRDDSDVEHVQLLRLDRKGISNPGAL